MEDIVYLEADSEITEAIDKLKSNSAPHVKLVVPARSSLLASVVNLKLLKKAATDSKKELALVTNDKTAKYLAGSIGLAVASNVKAEAKVPDVPQPEEPDINEVDEVAAEAATAAATKAAKKGSEKPDKSSDKDTGSSTKDSAAAPLATKQLDHSDADESLASKSAKNKASKIPNFNKFQKKLLATVLVVVGIVAVALLINFLAGAKVIITAQADKKAVNFDFVLDATATSSSNEKGIVAAKQVTVSKDLSGNLTATGKKDIGTKATGSLSFKNCEDSSPRSLPAGTKVSANGKEFTTNTAATIPGGNFSGGGTVCNSSAATIGVTAADNGDSYNLNNMSFASPGLTSNFQITGTTSGGTSKVVVVVSQGDVDKAKAALLEQDEDKIREELKDKAGKSTTVFDETFTSSLVSFNSGVAVGNEANSAAVTAKVDYSVLAASNDTLDSLFDSEIKKDLKNGTAIYQNGRSEAQYKVSAKADAQHADVSATSTGYVGEAIDKEAIAKATAGKSKKRVSPIVKEIVPSAQTVQANGVPLWPWMPLISSRIKVDIQVTTN